MPFTDIARPGLMMSQIAPNAIDEPGEIVRILETALDTGLYECFQTLHIPDRTDRARVAELIESSESTLTSTVARTMNREGWSLVTPDPALREKSLDGIRNHFDEARESGASLFGLLSGPAPEDPAQRTVGFQWLEESLAKLAADAPDLMLVIEPLDVAAHKKGALGYTPEAVRVVESVRKTAPNIALCLDTSHMLLNGENCIESLRAACDVTAEFHFCNVCLDPENEWFGDLHIPFGAPGVLDIQQVAEMMKNGADIGFFNAETRPGVFFEILNRGAAWRDMLDVHMKTLKQVQVTLEEGIQ